MTNLAPETGLAIYQARTKIEESFRDLKSLLHLDKVVNKTQNNMEKMVALVLIAYAIGLLVGESVRDHLYGSSEQAPATTSRQQNPAHKGKYWTLYSGLFVLLKQKVTLTHQVLEQLILAVQRAFACLVLGDVLCYV
jgi:transposase